MSNLLKGYWISVDDEQQRVVDSNSKVEDRIKEEAERRARLQLIEDEGYEVGDESDDGFREGIPFENIEALVDETAEEKHILKSANDAELIALNNELESARDELAQIQAEADRLLEDARAEAEDIKTEAFNSAREEGYQAGYNEGMQEVQSMKDELDAEAVRLNNEYENLVSELEPMFIDKLTDIYSHIFKVGLDDYASLVKHMLVETMNGAEGTRHFMIHISRNDYNDILEIKDDILAETGMRSDNVEFIQDATLSAGDCMVETESGVFDCSLDAELKELKHKLMLLSYQGN